MEFEWSALLKETFYMEWNTVTHKNERSAAHVKQWKPFKNYVRLLSLLVFAFIVSVLENINVIHCRLQLIGLPKNFTVTKNRQKIYGQELFSAPRRRKME